MLKIKPVPQNVIIKRYDWLINNFPQMKNLDK